MDQERGTPAVEITRQIALGLVKSIRFRPGNRNDLVRIAMRFWPDDCCPPGEAYEAVLDMPLEQALAGPMGHGWKGASDVE